MRRYILLALIQNIGRESECVKVHVHISYVCNACVGVCFVMRVHERMYAFGWVWCVCKECVYMCNIFVVSAQACVCVLLC